MEPEQDLKDFFLNEDMEKFLSGLVTTILEDLLLSGDITESTSKKEILDAIRLYLKERTRFDKITLSITIGDEFEKAIQKSIELGHHQVAIALAGICLEQRVNEFYQQFLLECCDFSLQEYSACMRSVSLRDKLTWLFRLCTSQTLEDSLVEQAIRLSSARNSIVHYKPRMEFMGDWESPSSSEKSSLSVEELLPIIHNVQERLQKVILLSAQEKIAAQKLFHKHFKLQD